MPAACAYRCRRDLGEAAYGHDELTGQTFYGFRCHVQLCLPGLSTDLSLAPGNVHALAALPELVDGSRGLVIGDRNYWSPMVAQALAAQGISLEAPFRSANRDPWPQRSRFLSRLRYRIDTVCGQLGERYHVKKVWARDSWHLYSRLLRKAALFLDSLAGNPPLQLERLLTIRSLHIRLVSTVKGKVQLCVSLYLILWRGPRLFGMNSKSAFPG